MSLRADRIRIILSALGKLKMLEESRKKQMGTKELKSFKEKVLLDSDKDAFQIRDLWELKDGNHILIPRTFDIGG